MPRGSPRHASGRDAAGVARGARRGAVLRTLVALCCATMPAPWALAGVEPPPRTAAPCCGPLTPHGRALLALLDQSGVERLWQPRTTVDWFSGKPRPTAPGLRPLASHCSAFVASMARRLKLEIPHPPEFSQVLLANRQAHWLAGPCGRAAGWRAVAPRQAQLLANRGWLVLAAFANPRPARPGHIAVVRPSLQSQARLWARGPRITQAGVRNWLSTSVARGFAWHRGAWEPGGTGALRFYAHAVDWAALARIGLDKFG